jgi:hypothetical protein
LETARAICVVLQGGLREGVQVDGHSLDYSICPFHAWKGMGDSVILCRVIIF